MYRKFLRKKKKVKNKKLYSGQIPFRDFAEIRYQDYFRPAYRAQLDYESFGDIIWKDNLVFIAQIEIESYSRGKSAANWSAKLHHVYCDSSPEYASFLEGCEVTIFMTDLLDVILHHDLYKGVSKSLKWAFAKRGANYGLCLKSEPEAELLVEE